MAGTSWLVDGKRIATKIKSASATCDPRNIKWKSNPTRACPKCNHIIDNNDITQQWPGLPRGVKFDPSDQEIIWHLLAKVGASGVKPHPFIDEFIPTVDEDDGICYTHPQNLPGVKQDGSVSHFFHRAIRAYSTGTRKRRKILDDDLGDVRWHKTGRTKPVILDGVQRGCKKIMVLYMSMARGGKPEKTNWVMHQYHLGTGEDEKDGEFVISKIFYQQQAKQGDKIEGDQPLDIAEAIVAKVDPVTPKSVTPDPPCTERLHSDRGHEQESTFNYMEPCGQHHGKRSIEVGLPPGLDELDYQDHRVEDCERPHSDLDIGKEPECSHLTTFSQHPETRYLEDEIQPKLEKPDGRGSQKLDEHDNDMVDNHENQNGEDPKWWEGESQFLLDSQQLVEGLSLCDELLQSQSSSGDGDGKEQKEKPRLSDYAQIGVEDLKRDLEECQKLSVVDPGNIELDTPPDFRLSQLEFESQDSYTPWVGTKVGAEWSMGANLTQ
ncbi:PREDICTED: NAC domain-containing protein 8-like [Nelumbo nucifera]|uniref:NAC domain-containing protein 8-like n=2 Tax=Nelumbo nucifera TaxID=4432 RepID=A0A1U8ABV8_NELNU|nr:PREDICTED: NAC domain-containing protein 8-like [Nelumbo nucifera]DAD35259.1 TPA_asm: hypothetical protein HUJ06_005899 [Nelumbo nucifera]